MVRGAAAAGLPAGLGYLAWMMWTLPWPLDAIAAIGMSAAWTAWIEQDTSEG